MVALLRTADDETPKLANPGKKVLFDGATEAFTLPGFAADGKSIGGNVAEEGTCGCIFPGSVACKPVNIGGAPGKAVTVDIWGDCTPFCAVADDAGG